MGEYNAFHCLFWVLGRFHSLDPYGKAYYRNLWNHMHAQTPAHNEFAYIKGRRRESAIKQHLILQHRLRKAGISHMDVSLDMTNALASLSFTSIDNEIKSNNQEQKPKTKKSPLSAKKCKKSQKSKKIGKSIFPIYPDSRSTALAAYRLIL